MGTHSIADARNHLSQLIDRALKGEDVVITRHGHAVVEMKPVATRGRRVTADDVAWLRQRRARLFVPDDDPKSIVERMRDEGNERLFRR